MQHRRHTESLKYAQIWIIQECGVCLLCVHALEHMCSTCYVHVLRIEVWECGASHISSLCRFSWFMSFQTHATNGYVASEASLRPLGGPGSHMRPYESCAHSRNGKSNLCGRWDRLSFYKIVHVIASGWTEGTMNLLEHNAPPRFGADRNQLQNGRMLFEFRWELLRGTSNCSCNGNCVQQ